MRHLLYKNLFVLLLAQTKKKKISMLFYQGSTAFLRENQEGTSADLFMYYNSNTQQ